MYSKWRQDVDVDGGQLVEAVEDEAVLPDHDGVHENSHAEDVVGLVPGETGGEEEALDQHGHVHEVTEVQHEQVLIECHVVSVSTIDIWRSSQSDREGPVDEQPRDEN